MALTATLAGAACNALCIPVFASWSDRVGRRPVTIAVALMMHAAMYGPQAALIAEQFPTHVRYVGCSVAYTLTGIVAGGVAPLRET